VHQRINKAGSATAAGRFIDERHECVSSGLNRSYLCAPLDPTATAFAFAATRD